MPSFLQRETTSAGSYPPSLVFETFQKWGNSQMEQILSFNQHNVKGDSCFSVSELFPFELYSFHVR